MAQSGSENRHRRHVIQTRLSDEEAALVRARAERAGISLSALTRHALLGTPPLRASRRPSIDRQEVCRMIAELGAVAQALRDAAAARDDVPAAIIEAAHRDIADMCHACFQALERRR
ncbi:MAG: hypothetical protein AB7H77_02820 [Bdellovibrionales bacterium]